MFIQVKGKIELSSDVQNSKSGQRTNFKFERDWSQHMKISNSESWAEPGVQSCKHPVCIPHPLKMFYGTLSGSGGGVVVMYGG